MYNEELKLRGAIVFFDPTLGVGDGQQQSGEVIVYERFVCQLRTCRQEQGL